MYNTGVHRRVTSHGLMRIKRKETRVDKEPSLLRKAAVHWREHQTIQTVKATRDVRRQKNGGEEDKKEKKWSKAWHSIKDIDLKGTMEQNGFSAA